MTASFGGSVGFLGSRLAWSEPAELRLQGPFPTDGNPYLHIESTPTALVWSPCGYSGPLEVRTQIALNSDGRSIGFVAMNAVIASVVDRVDPRPAGLDVDITSRRFGPLD